MPTDASLHIAILGAGAMGSLVGACLAAAGANVALLDVDEAHLQAIQANGLRVTIDGHDRVFAVAAMRPEAMQSSPDLLIVLTKQPHTAAALSAIRARLTSDCWVVTLQNGLGNQELIEQFVPTRQILVGVTTYPADMVGPGHVVSHGPGLIRLMTADGVDRPIAKTLAALFVAGGQDCVVDPAVTVAIWSKVAFNAALNSICAVTGSVVGGVAAAPGARQLAFDIAGEVVGVANAAGVPVDGTTVRDTIEDAMRRHALHAPSMLQDVRAGRATEIDAINGAVVRQADRVGYPVPLTRALLALVRVVEGRNDAA